MDPAQQWHLLHDDHYRYPNPREVVMSESTEAPERSLLEILEEALPIKRRVNIEGWPRPVWVWRLELAQILELHARRKLIDEDERGFQEWGVELLVRSLGDEGAPGAFASANGRSWLRRQAEAVSLLIPIAIEVNELGGPSDVRKKKSHDPTSEPCLPSPPASA